MAEETNNANATKMKKPMHRSPNYPVIGLEKAVERVTTLYEQGKLHPIPITTVYQMWNYSPSTGSQNVAALKAFGLIDVSGEKDARQIRVTENARKVIMNHPDRTAILKEMVLNPSLYNEVWSKYHGDLPVDSVIRNYLVFERNFNENAVDDFIREFRASIAYANLNSFDKIETDTESSRGVGSMETGQTNRQNNSAEFQPIVDDFLGVKLNDGNLPRVKPLFEYSVPLSVQRGVNATLRIDGQILKKRDLQILAKRVKELIDAFEEEEEENVVRLKAIWHNKDFDIPVIVVSNPEKAEDGREYVAIEGSDTRIPYDEIEIEDED